MQGSQQPSPPMGAKTKAKRARIQAKTGYNVKDCLADALQDLFKKQVPVFVELSEGR